MKEDEKMKRMKSLTFKLISLMSIILLVVCVTFGAVSYVLSSNAVITEVNKSLEQMAKEGAMLVKARLDGQINAVMVMADNAFISNPANPLDEKIELLKAEAERAGHVRMGIAALDGTLTSSNGAVSDIKDREYFKTAAAGDPAVSDPIISKVDGSVIIMIAVPMKMEGQVSGVLVAVRDGNALSDITDQLVFGESGAAFMISKNGTTIAHQNRDLVLNMDNDFENVKSDPQLTSIVELEKKMVAGETGVGSYEYNGVVKYMGYVPVEGTSWFLAVTAPQDEVLAGVHNLRNIILLVSVGFLLAGLTAAVFIARSFINPIKNIVAKIEEVAKGNLAIEKIKVKTQDELGVLGDSLNTMLDGLRSLVMNVSNMAEQVAASSEELTSSAEQQAQNANEVSQVMTEMAHGAEKQSRSVNEVTATVEQTSASMDQIAANSNLVARETNETALTAEEGHKAVLRAIDQMENIGQVSTKLQSAIGRLEQDSKEIGDITNVISGIAEQTNLLALNAAIEAARAGEQGRGFAVVAEEVRKLAEQSQTAAKQIAELITKNQANIDVAVSAMELSGKDIKAGIEIVNVAGQSFDEINSYTKRVSEQVQEMTTVINQVAQGGQALVDTIKELENISKESLASCQTVSAASEEQAASVEEIASASQNLAALAEKLQEVINQFKI